MKKFKFLFISIIAAIAIISCGGAAYQTPSSVVDSYLTGMEDGNYKKVAETIIIPEGNDVDMMAKELEKVFGAMTISYVDHEILSEEIDEENNTAKVKVNVDMDGKGNKVSRETTIKLKLIDGKWKVDM